MQVASRGIKSHRSKYEADETAKAADLQVAISKNNSQLPTVAYRVGVAEDDAEEEADGNVKLKSNDLDMIWNEGPQLIGLRFSSIQIPAKAKIHNAYIQFVADESDIGETNLKIQLLQKLDPPSFVAEPFNISSRMLRPAFVEWQPKEWSRNDCTERQRTPNIRSLIQEAIDSCPWKSGRAIGFVISGQGLRCASSFYRSPVYAPLLLIEYSVEQKENQEIKDLQTPVVNSVVH